MSAEQRTPPHPAELPNRTVHVVPSVHPGPDRHGHTVADRPGTGPGHRRSTGPGHRRSTVADLVTLVADEPLPLRITAFDGTDMGPPDSPVGLHVRSRAGLRHLLTAPGDLGLARAYLTGHLDLVGVHPGDPYPVFAALKNVQRRPRPSAAQVTELLRGLSVEDWLPPRRPTQEGAPRWRRAVTSLLTGGRAGKAISHHYDVGNDFYQRVLGPSMSYTCAVFATAGDSLEEAQHRKHALIAGKLGLRPGMRLLDVGCGWGGMVRHAARAHGVRSLGITLSREQADWARAAIEREGLSHLAEVRHGDYRDAPDEQFDAISSIGLTEHIGVRSYPGYFAFLRSRLRPGGRLLNHCITRADGHAGTRPERFTDRYVFPDGELAAPARLIAAATDAGLEIQHLENLRMHYAHTLSAWSANLVREWEPCLADAGQVTTRVWGLYLAGSRFAFERNWLQLHQILATRPGQLGSTQFPLRPDWPPSP